MGIFLVFATSDLRVKVPETCATFYMPIGHFAVVAYGGSADELARRLSIDRVAGPTAGTGAAVRRFPSRRALVLLALGAPVLISALRLAGLLI